MTAEELMERVNKATEKVEKCKKTIERHEKQAQKKLDFIYNNGWKPNRELYLYGGDNYNHDALMAIADYEWKLEDIEGAKEKLANAERILGNWKQKHETEKKKQKVLATEFPKALNALKVELAEQWTEWDIQRRNLLIKKERELTAKEFQTEYSYGELFLLDRTDGELRKRNERDAEHYVLDLFNRVKDKAGENIKDWSGIHFNGKALNGVVEGDKRTVRLETIVAGGYNIQRLHMRVLVK